MATATYGSAETSAGIRLANSNPATSLNSSMRKHVDFEKENLNQIADNFIPRQFEFRTVHRDRRITAVQLMSEFKGNFHTPIFYMYEF